LLSIHWFRLCVGAADLAALSCGISRGIMAIQTFFWHALGEKIKKNASGDPVWKVKYVLLWHIFWLNMDM
jgi:hypothetical protein